MIEQEDLMKRQTKGYSFRDQERANIQNRRLSIWRLCDDSYNDKNNKRYKQFVILLILRYIREIGFRFPGKEQQMFLLDLKFSDGGVHRPI
jgi:hypothetical protein